ncbi:MAG: TonB-dependent receptor, partial [Alphaproteobacteria bacterium]|nr:TonB-dependent receptor [Alphaproteobacteria bacterium]
MSAAPAMAQQQASANSNAASDSGVADIIVRAQRRDESLQKVPVAVTPVSGEDLRERKLNDLVQISLAVPSLSIGSDNAYSLRGVGSQIFTANIDSSVGVMVNDVSLGVPLFMSNGILDDVKSVEVLTGPQGLLFGRNSSAGLMNVISNPPVLGKTEGSVNLEYDDRDTAPGGHVGLVAKGMINLPVSQDSALRINALESYQDPIVKDVNGSSHPGQEDYQGRTAINLRYLYKPTSDLSVYIIGDYSRERGIGGIWDRSWRSVAPNGVEAANIAGDNLISSPSNLYFGAVGPDFRSVDTYGLSLNIKYNINSELTLSNIAAWRAYVLSLNFDSALEGYSTVRINNTHQLYNQFSDELRLAINHGKQIDGQVGLYIFKSSLSDFSQFNGDGAPLTGPTGIPGFFDGTSNYAQVNTSLAAYGQFNYHLTDQFTLLAGGRVTNDRVALNSTTGTTPGAANIVNLMGVLGPINPAPYTNTNFSYKIGGQYQVTPAVMAYVTWGTGYKGPSYNTTIAFVGENPLVLPETATDLEAGLKTSLFNHKLRLNISAFLEHFNNFQVQAFNAQGAQFVIENAATVKSQGIEINATARPTRNWTINYAATLQDAKFTNFPGNQCAPGLANCNGSFNGAGLATPTSAHLVSTLDSKYEFPIGAKNKLFI